ncbi:MAG: hypothetical protein P9X26_01255 [Candidatus Stygibacter frigidus]|nr:hypothetical protein [Candidatus Stygibacter frigidus]
MSDPRGIVKAALKFESPQRLPRDLWLLPIASDLYPETIRFLADNYPGDFTSPDFFYSPSIQAKGDPYKKGTYIDEWGCEFENIRDGIIGEVRKPLLNDISDWDKIKPPYEQLPVGEQKKKAYDHIAGYY